MNPLPFLLQSGPGSQAAGSLFQRGPPLFSTEDCKARYQLRSRTGEAAPVSHSWFHSFLSSTPACLQPAPSQPVTQLDGNAVPFPSQVESRDHDLQELGYASSFERTVSNDPSDKCFPLKARPAPSHHLREGAEVEEDMSHVDGTTVIPWRGGVASSELPSSSGTLYPAGQLHSCKKIVQRNLLNGELVERLVQVLTIHENPEVYLIPDLLTDEDCTHLLQLCEGRWEPSKTSTGYASADPRQYASRKSPTRTSWSVPLALGETAGVENVEKLVAAFAGMPVEHLEPLVIVKYEEGQYFKQHHDGGFRPRTVLLYLNDVEEGGETSFDRLGFRVAPMKGAALMWNNSHPGSTDIDSRLLHAGLPPARGVKFAVNCFFNKDPIRNEIQGIGGSTTDRATGQASTGTASASSRP
ncbi:2og-fe oxygenase family protein [Cystoisospora suis]|uniref:2og-fe oxygenase family protein n=1 Tax=Cystoisospora suis TaxID=483139 RepID=A0A2C6KZG5_9APIC|nr:2og-fe oxygenase family protein [Cystoisospora suis]